MAATEMDEASRLWQEYSTLKQLVDSHKQQTKYLNCETNRYSFVKPSIPNYNRFSSKTTDYKHYKFTRLPNKIASPLLTAKLPSFSHKTTTNSDVPKRPNLQAAKPQPTVPKISPSASAKKEPVVSDVALGSQQTRPDLKFSHQTTTVAADLRKKLLFKYKIITTNASKASSTNHKSKLINQRSSKYSWTANNSSVNHPPVTPNFRINDNVNGFIRSKYRLSKLKTTPKSINRYFRKVNKSTTKFRHSKVKNTHYNRSPKSLMWGANKSRFSYPSPGVRSYKSPKSKFVRNVVKHNGTKFSRHKMIKVDGVKFVVNSNRRRLRKGEQNTRKSLDGDQPPGIKGNKTSQFTPIVKLKKSNQTRYFANRAVNRSIFYLNVAKQKSKKFCLFYNKFGKCNKKENGTCPYVHDPEKIAVCKRFIRGNCLVDNCPFAHTHCRSKMPACNFFLLGTCHNGEACNYSHVNVNRDAAICSDFVDGYCASGEKCKKWHLTRCIQFEQKGHCDREKCPLLHRKKTVEQTSVPHSSRQRMSKSSYSTNTNCCEKIIKWEGPSQEPLPAFIPISVCDKDEPAVSVTGLSNSTLQIRPNFLMTGKR